MNIKEKNFNSFLIYLIGVLVVGILLCLNARTADNLRVTLEDGESSGGYVQMKPQLSLPAGDYSIDFGGREVVLETADGSVLSEGKGTVELSLDRDQSAITVKTKGNSDMTAVIRSDGAIFNDTYIVTLIIIIMLCYLGYIRFIKDGELSKSAVNVALIALALFATYPVMSNYISYGQDLNFHLYRIEGIKDGLLSGQFPVRIDPTHNNGYGYVTASVYPSLFLYIPAVLRLMGVSNVMSYKLFLFAINLATAFIMYISAQKITKSTFAGMLASIVYTLSTWRIINLIFRAAIGEALAMVFFPLVILGLYYLIKDDKKKWWVFALGATGIFNSHMISCIFVVMLTVTFIIVFIKDIIEDGRWLGFIKAGVLTLLLNLWYLIPFITFYLGTDLQISHTPENTEYFSNAIFPAELFNVFNDKFGYSQLLDKGISGNMSLSLGVGVTLCLVIAAVYFVFDRKNKIKDYKFNAAIFIFSIFILFMTTTLFPSELMQKSKLINGIAGTIRMPWRFLSLATPMICIVSSAVVLSYVNGEKLKKIVCCAACFICAVSFVFFGSAYSTTYNANVNKGQAPYTDGASGWDDEYFIYGTDIDALKANNYKASGVDVDSYEKSGTTIKVNISDASDSGYVEVPLLYYPGYSAKSDTGEKLEVVCGDNNVVRVNVESGISGFTVKYTGKMSFKIGCVVTDLTLLAVIAYALNRKFWKKDLKKIFVGGKNK